MQQPSHQIINEQLISPEERARASAFTVAKHITYGIKADMGSVTTFSGSNGKEYPITTNSVPSLAAMRALAQFYLLNAQGEYSKIVETNKRG